MSLPRLHTIEARVGVVGTYNTGKTVLLTSLINHLQDHDPDRFKLGNKPATVRKFTVLPPDPGWEAFNYTGHRDRLVNAGSWPAKTTDRSQYVCRFERSDWRFSDCVLKLYDLPGERFADALMLGSDFSAWSERVIAQFRNDTGYRECSRQYLDAIDRDDVTEREILQAYKRALANLILSYKPLISPSTFLLDAKGNLARMIPAEELAATRTVGLDAGSEFCPLPPRLRTTGTQPFEDFRARYDQYVERVVKPTILAYKSCTALVVMIDVTMILAGGVGMYDDNRLMLSTLFDVLAPGEHPLWGPLLRGLSNVFLPHHRRPGGITRVAFVASKLDLVHPADRDRLLMLLRRMTKKLAEDRDGLKYDYFNLSAVVSTRALPAVPGQPRTMIGVPLRDSHGRKLPPGPEQRFTVSQLPDDWPTDWRHGQFVFPEVYPRMPARKDYPPEQVELDRLATFVVS